MSIDYSKFAIPKPTQRRKKKRKDYTDISKEIKEIVWNRDNKKCISCGRYVSMGCANAHFIKRSQRWFRNTGKHCHIMSRMPL